MVEKEVDEGETWKRLKKANDGQRVRHRSGVWGSHETMNNNGKNFPIHFSNVSMDPSQDPDI